MADSRATKRAKYDSSPDESALGPGAELSSILRQLTLKRDTLARWCKSEFLEKIIRGKLVRVAKPDGSHELHVIVGVDQSTEAYALDFVCSHRDLPPTSSTTTTSTTAAGLHAGGDVTSQGSSTTPEAAFTKVEKRGGGGSSGGPPPAPPGYDTWRVMTRVKLKTAPAAATGGTGGKESVQSIRLSAISNSSPSSEELAQAVATPSPHLPDLHTAHKYGEEWRRLQEEAAAGCGAWVRAEGGKAVPWGSKSSSTGHFVLLLLRSWLAQDAVDEERRVGVWATATSTAPGAAHTPAPPPDATSFIPEIFRPCVASVGEGRAIDDHGYGPGPLRTLERVVGQYRYILQHRQRVEAQGQAGKGEAPPDVFDAVRSLLHPRSGGGGGGGGGAGGQGQYLLPLCTQAQAGYDEGQPSLTLWRALRQYVQDDITLQLAREAVIAQIDAASAASSSSVQGECWSSSGHRLGQALAGPVQVFVVDADMVARACASSSSSVSSMPHLPLYSRLAHTQGERAWLRRVLGKQPDVQSTSGAVSHTEPSGSSSSSSSSGSNSSAASRCPNSRIAKLLAETARKDASVGAHGLYRDGACSHEGSLGSTAFSPTGFVCVDEDQLQGLVRGGAVQVAVVGGGRTLTLALHPLLAALLLPSSVEHPSGQVQCDVPAPGSGLFEEGALPDASALSEALVRQNGSTRIRGRGTGLAAGESKGHWPPWCVYPLPHDTRAGMAESGSGDAGAPLVSFNPAWCPALFPHRNGRHITMLYHGTSPSMAAAIEKEGFRRAVCRMTAACKEGRCDDQMLGFGTYFGEAGKAFEYAIKRAAFQPGQGQGEGGAQGRMKGAVVATRIDLGHVQCATRVPCPCGCAQLYVDHYGSWYAQGGYDCLYLRDGSLPAARTKEWAVADPARTVVSAVQDAFTG